MSVSQIDAYLEQEIITNGKIVTYRLLSRKFSMHVNAAKNALASFYSRRRENKKVVFATFWLSGEPQTPTRNGTEDEMDVDDLTDRDWLPRKVIIVAEEDLENAKTMFNRIHALHVYSLSAAPLMTAALLCGPSHEVHELDKAGNNEFARKVGKIVSQQVKRGAPNQKPNRSSAAAKPLASASSSSSILKPGPKTTTQQNPKPLKTSMASRESGIKASGKLDWSKAKLKDTDKGSATTKMPVKAEVKQEPTPREDKKRGTKRKSDVMSQAHQRKEEEESEEVFPVKSDVRATNSTKSADTSSVTRIKRGVVLSDDESEIKTTRAAVSTKAKLKQSDESESERSIRAMMDIDDSLVTNASAARSNIVTEDESEEPPATDHVDSAMDSDSDDPAPKAKPRKRKQKKSIPRGRNGLPKKRVVKSKTESDEKGYMVTIDYSSYESVDEEDELPNEHESKPVFKATTANSKKRASSIREKVNMSASDSETQSRVVASAESNKAAMKKTSGKPSVGKGRQSNGSQKSLASFFGPGGGKGKK